MSYAAERWARSQTVGNSTAKAVLRELAFYHNGQTGLCCPSVSKIARVLEVKKADTITAAIKRLEEGGFISREFIRDPETGQILRTEYALIGFVASEWVSSKNQDTSPEDQDTSPENRGISPENRGTSPENRGTVPQKRGIGSPEKRGEGSPKNQDVTGNKNREIEQGSRTRNSLPERTPLDDDQDEQKQNSQEKASRSKRIRLTIEVLPDDWREYCAKVAPEIDPDKAWEDFKDYWQVKAKDPLSADWKRTWQSNVRKLHSGPDWMKGHLMKASVRSFKNAKNVTQTAEYRERLQACCRGEGRNEKLADDGVTIIVD